MRLTAARMVGDVEIKFSAVHSGLGLGLVLFRDGGEEGKSREGKSSMCFGGVVEGVLGGGEVRGVGVWKWTWERLWVGFLGGVMIFVLEGDVGGVE